MRYRRKAGKWFSVYASYVVFGFLVSFQLLVCYARVYYTCVWPYEELCESIVYHFFTLYRYFIFSHFTVTSHVI